MNGSRLNQEFGKILKFQDFSFKFAQIPGLPQVYTVKNIYITASIRLFFHSLGMSLISSSFRIRVTITKPANTHLKQQNIK